MGGPARNASVAAPARNASVMPRAPAAHARGAVGYVHVFAVYLAAAVSAVSNKMRKKRDLPEKVCPVCNRPFKWRKKWKDDWDNVKYCSERCRRNKEKA